MMLKLAVVSLLSSKALSVIDDSSALIQQRFDDFDNTLLRGDSGANAKICSQKELDRYAAALEAFQMKDQAKRAARAKEASDTAAAAAAAAQEKTTAYLAFFKPILHKVEMVGKYLQVETPSTGLLVVKSLLHLLLFNAPLVGTENAVDGNNTVQEVLRRWDQELVVHVKSLLKDGFDALDKDIENGFLNLDPVVQAHIYNATYPVHNSTELQAYVLGKFLPVTVMKTFPMLEDVAKVLATMPDTNASAQRSWVLQQVMPVLTQNLPPACQQARFLTTLGLGSGDIAMRFGKFIKNCKKAMGMEEVHKESEALPPTRKCSTCEELYYKQASYMTDPNGCMLHCAPVAVSCFQGLTDDCLHKFYPCLRCHKRKLAALDDCLGIDAHANMIEILGKLSTITKTATTEGGVNASMLL